MLSVGDELKDGFDISINYLEENIVFIENIKQYYGKRKQLDDLHMQNLKKLNLEQLDIVTKQSINVSVGSKPIMTPGSLTNSTIATFKNIINSDNRIDGDIGKANDIIINELSKLLNDLRQLSQFLKTMYKDMLTNFQNISETNLNSFKKKYDESTKNMEQVRNKGSSSDKVLKKEILMNEAKNNYLIEIALANRVKDKLYFQDIPELLDLLQNIVKYKVQMFNKILKKNLENNIVNFKSKTNILQENIQYLDANLPELDIEMFIKHNKKPWQEPQDKTFIPSPIWYEEAVFNVKLEEDLKILSKKYKQAINDKAGIQDNVNKNLETLKTLRTQLMSSNSENETLNLNTLKQYCSSLQKFTALENDNLRVQVVIDSLKNNFKDINLDNLNFKEEKSHSGFFSKLKFGKNKSSSSKSDNSSQVNQKTENNARTFYDSDDVSSISQSLASTRISSFAQPDVSRTSKSESDTFSNSAPNAVALYAYAAQADDEISISATDLLTTLSADMNGWIQVLNHSTHNKGNVPTSYVKIETVDSGKKVPPTVVPRRRKNTVSKNTLVCKYDYVAQGEDEISIKVGDCIEILNEADENGWALGLVNGQQGLFPVSYC